MPACLKANLFAFRNSGNLGQGLACVLLWDRLGRTRICFQLLAPPDDPVTGRLLPPEVSLFESGLLLHADFQ